MFLLLLLQDKKRSFTLFALFMALGVVPICVCAGVSHVIATHMHNALTAEFHDGWVLFSFFKMAFIAFCFYWKVIETEERYQLLRVNGMPIGWPLR